MSKRIIGGIVFVISIAVIVGIIFLTRKNHETDYLIEVHSKAPLGKYHSFAVSSDASECAPLGRRILEKNGTAVDSAITVLLCMSLVLPHSLGLGGGSFITFYHKESRKGVVYDGREQAPQHVRDTKKFNKTNLQDGLLSIAIPGELQSYYQAHKDYGMLPWSELFKEVIYLAENGVKVNRHLATNIQKNKNRFTEPLRKILTNEKNGEYLKEGDTLVRKDLAATYKMIADSEDPIGLFYRGELADQFVKELDGSGITKEDFENYSLKKSDAIEYDLDDENRLLVSGSPSSGVILGFIMKAVAKLKDTIIKKDMEHSLEDTAWFYHQLTEIFKHAYSRRALVADPDFETNATEELLETFARFKENDSNKYLDDVLEKIKNSKVTNDQEFYGGKEYFVPDNGTAHMSIIDQYGNAISVTSTVNIYFGSGVVSKSGIIFNDEHDDFSVKGITNYFGLPPSKANLIEPGKRPASSMCPVIVVNRKTNEPKLSIGAAGGSLIISGMVEAITRILYMNEDIKTSIDQWRFHHQLYPNVFQYEIGFNGDLLKKLNETYKHAIVPITNRRCIISAVSKDKDGNLYSHTDYRKGGSIDGI